MDWTPSSLSQCSRLCRRGENLNSNVYCCADSVQTGMPIGLSLVSGRYRDQKLVAVAKEVAKVFKGAHGGQIHKLPGVPSGLV